jgi:hypothetical protein
MGASYRGGKLETTEKTAVTMRGQATNGHCGDAGYVETELPSCRSGFL